RVLERMFGAALKGAGATKETAWLRAEALLSRERPGDFNQAMMELGATICTPRQPQCLVCPVMTWCGTRGAGERHPQAARKRKQLWYGLAQRGDQVLLVQRPADASLMAGMWELPPMTLDGVSADAPLAKFRHSITDTDYEIFVAVLS